MSAVTHAHASEERAKQSFDKNPAGETDRVGVIGADKPAAGCVTELKPGSQGGPSTQEEVARTDSPQIPDRALVVATPDTLARLVGAEAQDATEREFGEGRGVTTGE